MRAMNRALVQQQGDNGHAGEDSWQQLQESMFNTKEASEKAKQGTFLSMLHLLANIRSNYGR